MNNTKKINIIVITSLLGTLIGLMIFLILKDSFLFNPSDRFMDYFNTLTVSQDVYSEVGIGRGYFPFTYVVLNIIKVIFTSSHIGYFITFLLVSIILIIFYTILLEKDWKSILLVSILSFLSYPMIFTFDRANIEYLVFGFLLLFFIAYKKERYKTAAVLLALPICMKLYPAVFILLFLNKKQIKAFFICVIVSMILMSSSYFLINGTIETIPVAIENFRFFTNTYGKTESGVQFSHTLWSGLNYLSEVTSGKLINPSYMTAYTIIIVMVALVLACYIIFIEKEDWKAITILTIMMITFPHVSFDYTLIHMYIPILFFIITKETNEWEKIVFSVLLGLSIIPMNWLQTVIHGNITLNLGLIIRPLVLLAIMVIIVFTTIKTRRKEKHMQT